MGSGGNRLAGILNNLIDIYHDFNFLLVPEIEIITANDHA